MKHLIILLIAIPIFSYSQIDTNDVYLYSGINFSHSKYENNNETNYITYFSPVVGLNAVDKRKNINNFEINNMTFRRVENNFEISDTVFSPQIVMASLVSKSTTFNASYHKIIGLNKKMDSKFYFGIGIGAILFIDHRSTVPSVSYWYATRRVQVGNLLTLKPIINYSINEKCFIGISSHIYIAEQIFNFSYSENPRVPVQQQLTRTSESDFFNFRDTNLQLVFGINLR